MNVPVMAMPGEQRDHRDREDVLDDQDAEDELRKTLLLSPSSPSALMMMVVEEMERMAPRKMLSMLLQPNA